MTLTEDFEVSAGGAMRFTRWIAPLYLLDVVRYEVSVHAWLTISDGDVHASV